MRYLEETLQDDEYRFPYHYISSFTPQFSNHLVDTWALNYVSTIEYILEALTTIDFSTLIDMGCGDGRITREIAMRYPMKHITGVDYSDRAISLACAMNGDVPQLDFVSADIESWDGKSADVVVLVEVLEHIPSSKCEAFVAGLNRMLKTGGRLLVTVPHQNKKVEYKHFQHFTAASLCTLLEPQFIVNNVMPFERSGVERRLLERLLVNRLWVLNNTRLLNWSYGFYRRRLFHCDTEAECQRLFVLATAR